MKKKSGFFIISFLLLLIAALPSYAETKASFNKMEKGMKNEEHPSLMFPTTMPHYMGPPLMFPPTMPHYMGLLQGMLQFRHPNLNLDEKQKEAMKGIENSVTKELIRKKADEHIAEVELRELLDKDNVDLKAVEIKLKQIATIKTETQLLIIKTMEKMKEKLTPKQRTLLKKQAEECRMKPPLKGIMTPGNPPFAGENR
jgi:Spy/CpxP family protein refolding chaperone